MGEAIKVLYNLALKNGVDILISIMPNTLFNPSLCVRVNKGNKTIYTAFAREVLIAEGGLNYIQERFETMCEDLKHEKGDSNNL